MQFGPNETSRGAIGPGPYSKPSLERLGTFRELTQSGGSTFSDLFTIGNGDGACRLRSSACIIP